MGPKILAAFGAGALVMGTAMFFLRQVEVAQPTADPLVIPSVVAAAQPEPAVTPKLVDPAPAPKAVIALRKKKAKVFRNASVVSPKRLQPPAPAAISLPDSADVDAAEDDAPRIADTPSAPIAEALPPRPRQTVTVPAGTLLQVRLAERLSTDRNVTGDAFAATLDQPLVVDGYVVAERGARVLGHLVDVEQAGRVKGVAEMTLALASLTTADGQKIDLRTAEFVRKGATSHRNDAVKVGAGAAIGAVIGAIAGGGKGAAIGAASGGAAGTGAVLATRGKAAVLDPETRLSFKLDSPITITER